MARARRLDPAKANRVWWPETAVQQSPDDHQNERPQGASSSRAACDRDLPSDAECDHPLRAPEAKLEQYPTATLPLPASSLAKDWRTDK
jgi:hypothetical protein